LFEVFCENLTHYSLNIKNSGIKNVRVNLYYFYRNIPEFGRTSFSNLINSGLPYSGRSFKLDSKIDFSSLRNFDERQVLIFKQIARG